MLRQGCEEANRDWKFHFRGQDNFLEKGNPKLSEGGMHPMQGDCCTLLASTPLTPISDLETPLGGLEQGTKQHEVNIILV